MGFRQNVFRYMSKVLSEPPTVLCWIYLSIPLKPLMLFFQIYVSGDQYYRWSSVGFWHRTIALKLRWRWSVTWEVKRSQKPDEKYEKINFVRWTDKIPLTTWKLHLHRKTYACAMKNRWNVFRFWCIMH